MTYPGAPRSWLGPLLVATVAATSACRPLSIHPEPGSSPDDAFSVRVLPSERRIEVAGTVRLPAVDLERKELRFRLGPSMSAVRVEVVAPSVSAGPAEVERVADSDRPRVEGERSDTKWILRPRRPIPGGQAARLRFTYEGSGEVSFLYYIGPEIAFATGWGDSWYPVIAEAPGQTTGQLRVVVPEGWTTVTGRPGSSHLTFVAGPYTVVHSQGAVPIAAYLLKPRDHFEDYLTGVRSMLDTLEAEFGPYPFDELVLVEVPRELAKQSGFNAFSPAGMLVLNSRAFDASVDHLLEWLGHEMSHQWFPHAVTFDPPGFPYMEEAMAEYGGLRIVEALGGPDAARRTRTSGFEFDPIYSASAYFKQVGAGMDRPLADMGEGIDQRNLAYNKGSFVFEMLSREVGPATFQRVLHDLTRGRRFHTMTWDEFARAVDAGSGRSLDWFFEQWLHRAGAPDLESSFTQSGDVVRITVTQQAPIYRVRLKLEIRGSEGQRQAHELDIDGPQAELTVSAGFHAESVVLDPDYELLRWTPEFHALVDAARNAVSSTAIGGGREKTAPR